MYHRLSGNVIKLWKVQFHGYARHTCDYRLLQEEIPLSRLVL